MQPTLILNCVLVVGLFTNIGAITVSIDRSDNKPPPTRSSMIGNGWRPLTSAYEEVIGTNVSPSSILERNVPVHPVLGKLQEHMAASEKLKPQRKGKPTLHHDYSPPSILGSFTVFGHAAAKARGEAPTHNHLNKHVGQETREYTFLIPPPKDAYRFDLDHHRKPILRDNSPYLRQPQYIPQMVHQPPDPLKAATYFIKGYTSTTNTPSSPETQKNRHYGDPFVPQQLQPPRYPVKPFESLKVSNAKPYFQPPGPGSAPDFGKDKRLSEHDHRSNFEKYPGQGHNDQILNPASTGNFYSQVNHQAQSYKTSYERDPAFLVHESHEISYITPPTVYNGFNLRPSLPFETLLPPDVYTSSTPAPTTPRVQEQSKYHSGELLQAQDYKRPSQSSTKRPDNGAQAEALPTAGIANTYYVSEHQDLTPPPAAWPVPKSKYTADINEVLPRVNPPSKFNQEAIGSNQIPQAPNAVYVPPQQPQYQSSVLPIDIRPETAQPEEYETPESISLKHFNEQQYLIQQQLLQRDRQRLAEQERQQQLEIEKQQQEELKKRQEEVRQLLRQQKEEEEARLAVESAKNQSEQLAKVAEGRPPYAVQLTEYEVPKVTTDFAAVITQHGEVGELPRIQQTEVIQPDHVYSESPIDPSLQYQDQLKSQPEQVTYREQQPDPRPNRPFKLSRDQYRRRKPSTVAYEPTPTEAPIQVPETAVPVTLHIEEIPIQTTVAPEVTTLPTVTTQKARTRRPGAPLRRRRPTTTTQEPITVPETEEFLKYDRPEDVQQLDVQQLDATRRRRIKPTQAALEETVTKKKANIRKRPGHRNRVNPGEPFEAEIVTEIVHTPVNTYRAPTETIQNYEYNQFVTNQPVNPFDFTSQRFATVEEQREDITEPVPLDYLTEVTKKAEELPEGYNPQQGSVVTNIPLEDLFGRTEGNYYDRATVVSSTSSSVATSTSTEAPTTASTFTVPSTTQSAPASSTRPLKMRPIRYGNTTRPRFSIKDYKSRLDYKSRQGQGSTTEPSATPASGTKQRGSIAKNQQTQQGREPESTRENTGRYKYVSRGSYRTSSPSPQTKDQYQAEVPAEVSSTTERSNRFVPKRRPISSNVYRSRIAGTTSSPRTHESEAPTKPSQVRPENVFSSSVRRRPMKGRLSSQKESSTAAYERKETEATEMAAEETSFYSAITTMGTTRVAANEIPVEKEEAVSTDPPRSSEEDRNPDESETGLSLHEENENPTEPVASSTAKILQESQVKQTADEQFSTVKTEDMAAKKDQGEDKVEATTGFSVQADEEELFAKASQSVADLTSSASALYDKPGMFKAVSPESRVVSSHFKIPTDEPTLPIEAFFQELSKKS